MYFEPFGPFDLRPTLNSEDRNWKSIFWEEVEKYQSGLSKANGIYIFSLKNGSNYVPWYVGKTCSENGFSNEVFQNHKLQHYYSACEGRNGKQFLHLIARVEKNRGNFCNWSKQSEVQIENLETHLIGMALARNAKLRNDKKTKFFRSLDIAGVIGPKYKGRPKKDAQTLKNLLGLTIK